MHRLYDNATQNAAQNKGTLGSGERLPAATRHTDLHRRHIVHLVVINVTMTGHHLPRHRTRHRGYLLGCACFGQCHGGCVGRHDQRHAQEQQCEENTRETSCTCR